MSFTTTKLAGSRVLVEGTDVRGNEGQQVVDSAQWDSLTERTEVDQAKAEFEAKTAAFFAPLTEAADAVKAAIAGKGVDPLLTYTVKEATAHVFGNDEQVVRLTNDSVILRAIEEGQDDRLIWVNDELVLTAV